MPNTQNSNLKTLLNAEIIVGEQLGEGGQGCVFRVRYNGAPKAMKLYKPEALKDAKAFYENLADNVVKGSPSPAFLWPQDVVRAFQNKAGNTTFGYIMDLYPEGYKELPLFFSQKDESAKFASFRTMVDAALHITSAFRILHSMGYSYQDLNDRNFFIHPKTGMVRICDNDNVAPNGTHTGILGSRRFMAPEIVRGEAMPSTNTDRFSLAVLIFMILTNSHPLEGVRYLVPCLTPEVEMRLYGTEPIFILDPTDTRNAPVRSVHRNIAEVWPSLPKYLREAFMEAFSKERIDTPDLRYTEQQWEELLIRLRSDILPCSCGGSTFVWDHNAPICEDCRRRLPKPSLLELGGCKYDLPLIPGAVVYRSQFGTANVDAAGTPVLRTVVNPEDRSLHLLNVSDETLECITPSGRRATLAPKEPAPVTSGLVLRLGGSPNQAVRIR